MTTKRTAGRKPQVLLLSNERDLSIDWVVRELRRRDIDYLRLNTERCAEIAWTIDPPNGRWSIELRRQRVHLDDVRAVLYRRPEPPRFQGLAGSDRRLALGQWAALVAGLASISAKWVSPPHLIARAESKILQLRSAALVGLSVPSTLVTNSRGAASRFADRNASSVVIKALDAPLVGPKRNEGFVFATLLSAVDLAGLGEPDVAPVIVQRPVMPKADLRVTVVGHRVLAAKTSALTFDWRQQDPAPSFEPVVLPKMLEKRCVAIVRQLGLSFGALDFVIDEKGRYFFLELNPNGEWGWLQRSGIPIAQAIVDELVS